MYIHNDDTLGQDETQLIVSARQARSRSLPGGDYDGKTAVVGFYGLAANLGQCIPLPALLTNPAHIEKAVRNNPIYAQSAGWGPLRDQIEVNILRCPRSSPRLNPINFAQAVAGFQRSQGLTVDGILGTGTWDRMKALQVEREPFPRPRHNLSQDFDATRRVTNCEAHVHPAIDVSVPAGTPVPVVADGVVRYAGIVGSIRNCAIARACQAGTGTANTCNLLSYGRAVLVEHPDRGPGGRSVYTVYAHLKNLRVSSGEPVKAGRIIGEVGVGCVGFSSGPHLHYVVATGPRSFRFTAGGPARCQICAADYCRAASCPRCDFTHFWDVVTPQRPRTTSAPGFRW